MRIVTFGEIMLRLSPEGFGRLFQSDRMQATFGGAEANVAISLAQFGMDTAYVTKLPENAVGQAAIRTLCAYGVDTSKIARGGSRVGIYYLEKGAGLRSSACLYDRAHSAISEAAPCDFDWDSIFDGADWFHFTGITPALGGELVEICRQACRIAKEKGVKISCDLNYRSTLWSKEAAQAVMSDLCQYVDVCIAGVDEIRDVLGIEPAPANMENGRLTAEGCQAVSSRLVERFGFEKVAIILYTAHTAFDCDWSGMLFDGTKCHFSGTYRVQSIDRVGIGDAFGAGLIYPLLSGYDCQSAIEFAVAASALKHSVEGDFNRVSVSEVQRLAGGAASGCVQR